MGRLNKAVGVKDDGHSFGPRNLSTFVSNGMDLEVRYDGKIEGDVMELTRKVGEFTTERIVARRVGDGK